MAECPKAFPRFKKSLMSVKNGRADPYLAMELSNNTRNWFSEMEYIRFTMTISHNRKYRMLPRDATGGCREKRIAQPLHFRRVEILLRLRLT